jgi:hypothetical protein
MRCLIASKMAAYPEDTDRVRPLHAPYARQRLANHFGMQVTDVPELFADRYTIAPSPQLFGVPWNSLTMSIRRYDAHEKGRPSVAGLNASVLPWTAQQGSLILAAAPSSEIDSACDGLEAVVAILGFAEGTN